MGNITSRRITSVFQPRHPKTVNWYGTTVQTPPSRTFLIPTVDMATYTPGTDECPDLRPRKPSVVIPLANLVFSPGVVSPTQQLSVQMRIGHSDAEGAIHVGGITAAFIGSPPDCAMNFLVL